MTIIGNLRKIRLLAASCLSLAACMPFMGVRAQAQNSTTLYSASAYGAGATALGSTLVARVAPVAVGSGCGTAQVGAHQSATVASVFSPPIITTNVVTTDASSSSNQSRGSADVFQANLLGGFIVADEVKAVSTTTSNNGVLSVSSAGSHFVNLIIAGNKISDTPAPNTTIQLTGFGKVVLNEQLSSSSANQVRLTVNMIHVYVTVANNVLGLKVGTQIIVANASSGITFVTGPSAIDGFAYGAYVSARPLLLTVGPVGYVSLPCFGDEDATQTSTVASVNVPGVLNSLTITDTVQGDADPGDSHTHSTSQTQAANVLAGFITADVIQAQANASTTDGTNFTFTSSGSFLNLKVQGHPEITDNVAPNTTVSIAGLGTLYLHRVIQGKNTIEVRMIELVVNQQNRFGLPLGADIRVTVAEASLHSINKP